MRIWIAAAVLPVLVVLSLAALPLAIDWDARRPEIEAAATAVTGHQVTIAGPIKVALLPRPLLTVRDVTMRSGAASAGRFEMTSQRMDLGLRPQALLTGRAVVDDLMLSRPELVLDRDASERLRAWPPEFGDWLRPFRQPGLTTITISDGRLVLTGGRSEETALVSELTLKLAIAGPNGRMEAGALFKTRHHRFSLAGDLGSASDSTSTLKLTIEAQNDTEEITSLAFSGTFDRDPADPELQGTFRLGGPDLRSGLNALSAATGYSSTFLSLAAGQPFEMRGQIDASRRGVGAEEVALTLGDERGSGRMHLELEPEAALDLDLDLPTLHLADGAALMAGFVPLDLLSALPTMPGRIDIRMREAIYRSASIRQGMIAIVTGDDGLPRIEEARVLLPGLTDVSFKGALRAEGAGRTLDGRLAAVGDDLGQTLEWLGLVPAERGRGWRGFSLESDLEVSNVEIALSGIDLRLDSSKAEGRVSLRFSDRLQLGLDMAVDRLNLDLYPAVPAAADLAGALAGALGRMDASIDARFERLAWQARQFEQVALAAKAEHGRLDLEKLDVQTVGETAIAVAGMIDLEAAEVDLNAELDSRFPSRLLRHVAPDLPHGAARLEPVALNGWIKGRLNGFDMKASANYDEGHLSVEGNAGWIDSALRYDLAIEADHPDHQRLAGQFGLAPLLPAGDAPGSLQITGQLLDEPDARWLAAGSAILGPTTVTGRLVRQRQAPRDRWEAKVSVGNPMRDSLTPILRLLGIRPAAGWSPGSVLGRLPHAGFRTGWLDDLDGSLTLLSKGGLAGDGVNLSARLDQGLLAIDRLQAGLWGGELRATMSLERRRDQPVGSVGLTLDGVRAPSLAEWLGLPDVVDGPLDLQLDARAVGQTPYQLMAGLSGRIDLAVAGGRLSGNDVPGLRRRLVAEAADDFGPDANPLTMPFAALEAHADLARGIASITEGGLVLEPSAGRKVQARLDGTVDLLLWIAELTMTVEADAGDTAGEPLTYRMVGPPGRPQGLISSGKQ